MEAPRKIIHVDMDAFYASVEQRDNPDLRGRPVVVAWRGARSVVCAASYEARRFGVRSAMPALRAERLCPQAVFVPPDFSRYKAVSKQIRDIFARHTDLIEPLSLDEAYLDVTTPKTAMGSATAIAEHIRAAIRAETALTASAGVAGNKFLAKLASDWNKPDGLFVIRPGQALGLIAPLPVGRLPGVGKVTERQLQALGIDTVGALAALGEAALTARFGRWGRRLFELSQGIDHHPVEPDRPYQQMSAEDTFTEDLPLAALEPTLRELAGKVWSAYQKESGRVARTVVLKLKTADFRILTRSHTPPQPPASLEDLIRISIELKQRVELPASTRFRLLGIGLNQLVDRDSLPQQSDLFDSGLIECSPLETNVSA